MHKHTHKSIFSTIGLGIILTIILGLAAASVPTNPAVAQGGEFRVKEISQKIDDSRARLLSTTDGKPYNLGITTWWELENYQGCSSDSVQTLDRKAAGGQWERVWIGTGTSTPKLYTRVWTHQAYSYNLAVHCITSQGIISDQDEVGFMIDVVENDEPSQPTPDYRGSGEKPPLGAPAAAQPMWQNRLGPVPQ